MAPTCAAGCRNWPLRPQRCSTSRGRTPPCFNAAATPHRWSISANRASRRWMPTARLPAEAGLAASGVVAVRECRAVATGGLAAVQRPVGGSEQLVTRTVLAVGDADAERGIDAQPGGNRRKTLPDQLRPADQFLAAGTADGHGKFVTAKACNQVLAAHRLAKRCTDGGQHLVAHVVTHRVVDRLEAIGVDQQHADAVMKTAGARQRVLPAGD